MSHSVGLLSSTTLATECGLEIERVEAIRGALGLTGTVVSDDDIEALRSVRAIEAAGVPWPAILEGTRVLGDALRKIAHTEARLVHTHLHEQLITAGLTAPEAASQARSAGEALLPLMDALLVSVHRKHLLRATLEDAYLHPAATSSERAEPPGSLRTTIVFLDIASFTTLTETKGDEAAANVIDRLDTVVRRVSALHSGHLVKQIGDAWMFVFDQAKNAVQFAVGVASAIDDDSLLPMVRIGINQGVAVYRVGEYIGAVVNVASRVTALATEGEILVTESVADAAAAAGFATSPAGVRALRGLVKPLPLFRLAKPEASRPNRRASPFPRSRP